MKHKKYVPSHFVQIYNHKLQNLKCDFDKIMILLCKRNLMLLIVLKFVSALKIYGYDLQIP